MTIYYIYYILYSERNEREKVKMEELKNIIKQELQKAYEETLEDVEIYRCVDYNINIISTNSIEYIYENVYNNLENLHSDNLENKDSQELLKELYIQKVQTDILLLLKEMAFDASPLEQGRANAVSSFRRTAQELLAKYE